MVMIVILLPSLIHRLIWGELDCYFVIVIVIFIVIVLYWTYATLNCYYYTVLHTKKSVAMINVLSLDRRVHC